MTDEGAARVVVEGGRAVGTETAAGNRFLGDAVLLATGSAVPKMVEQAGETIDDATPVALLVRTKPLAHPLRAVLTRRVSPSAPRRAAPSRWMRLGGDEGVKMHEDGCRDIDAAVVDALLAEASKVMEGNPKLEIASIGVGGKPIPGDGEPVLGALKAIPATTSPSATACDAWPYRW